ncbi:MAG: MobB family relaxase [Leeuwenhoekiella sp.]
MYITITPQKLGKNFSKSVSDFVDYLEKENEGVDAGEREFFFNQYEDNILPEQVVKDIDNNTAKLEKTEPRFYSITVSPSKYELSKIQNDGEALKKYTKELMKDYVTSFNREINGRPIRIEDIKYYAKIEHQRSFKGNDKQVRENQAFTTKILELKNEIKKVEKGQSGGSIAKLQKEIGRLERQAPHQQDGKRIVQGMAKAGNQCHIHIVVSRKDASNTFSLSPGSKYKASSVELNGKNVKRGFDRDKFFDKAEKTFDRMFSYERNFAERYASRKEFVQNPKNYFKLLMNLPLNEKTIAMKLLRESGMPMLPNIPINKVQLAWKTIDLMKKGVGVVVRSSSIGI